jgi:hypothetical protein
MRRRAVALPVTVLAAVVAAGCGGSPRSVSAPGRRTATGTVATVPATTAATSAPVLPPPRPKPHPKPKPNPGSLPQTDQLPSAGTAAFHAEMAALWRGVARNSVAAALPAFFPEGAYVQLKQIGDPQGDWVGRLVEDYRLDLAAAHDLLGGDGRDARLVEVVVPSAYAHWVTAGVCYNAVGYYEVPNARVVYRQGGVIRSFGIASMISWRGVWYVVHLGSVLRPTAVGLVDDPSTGSGASAPSSTC